MTKVTQKNLIKYIIAFEDGNLSDKDTIDLFQHLVDTGQAWTLQGMYGRMAHDLIQRGLVRPPVKKKEVIW